MELRSGTEEVAVKEHQPRREEHCSHTVRKEEKEEVWCGQERLGLRDSGLASRISWTISSSQCEFFYSVDKGIKPIDLHKSITITNALSISLLYQEDSVKFVVYLWLNSSSTTIQLKLSLTQLWAKKFTTHSWKALHKGGPTAIYSNTSLVLCIL